MSILAILRNYLQGDLFRIFAASVRAACGFIIDDPGTIHKQCCQRWRYSRRLSIPVMCSTVWVLNHHTVSLILEMIGFLAV